MKNIILTFSFFLVSSSFLFSQEISTLSYSKVEVGKVVNGSVVKIFTEKDKSIVKFKSDTIEISNSEESVILTDVEFIGDEKLPDMEINRYKCKNPSGDLIICSVADGVLSIFNIENNSVKTLIASN
jgi:hypothetical protein